MSDENYTITLTNRRTGEIHIRSAVTLTEERYAELLRQLGTYIDTIRKEYGGDKDDFLFTFIRTQSPEE